MVVRGTVREWYDPEGYGVLDSPETPGGCWVYWAELDMPGYRTLQPGQAVEFTFVAERQDGYPFQARWVKPL